MLSLLPEPKKGGRRAFLPEYEITAPRAPLTPFPEVLERMKELEHHSKPLPRILLNQVGELALFQPKDKERPLLRENWYNYLALKFMQVSLFPVEWLPEGVAYSRIHHGTLHRLLAEEVKIWDQTCSTPPDIEGEEGDDFTEEGGREEEEEDPFMEDDDLPYDPEEDRGDEP